MSLILSGTDGLSDVDGSAATPAIRGSDANTGIFFPAADTIAFSEGGVEAARFDASGNLGIGKIPSTKLDVNGAISAVGDGSSVALYAPADQALRQTGASGGAWYFDVATGGATNGSFIWRSSNAYNERMRIDSSGQLGLGKTPSLFIDTQTSADALFSLASTGTIQSSAIILVGRQSSTNNTWNLVSTGNGLAGPQFRIAQTSWTSGTPEFVINANGAIALKGGNTGASGVGITFPATQSASTDVNTLDDYEEGTYTATMTTTVSGTITLAAGIRTLKYTKIGNAVTIQGRVNIASVSSPSGGTRISLPFLPTSGSGGESDYMCFNVYTHGVDLDPSAVSIFAETNGTTNASIFQVRDNQSWQALNSATLTGSGNEYFYMIGTYMAA